MLALLFQQRRGSDAKEDSGDKPRRNVSWHDKSKDAVMMSQGVVQNTADLRHVGHVDIHRIRCYLSLLMYTCISCPSVLSIVRHFFLLSLFTVNTLIIDLSHLCSDPVVVPVESEEEKAEHSDPEKEEDIGITFVARKTETPKHRPQSGESSVM